VGKLLVVSVVYAPVFQRVVDAFGCDDWLAVNANILCRAIVDLVAGFGNTAEVIRGC